MFSLIPFENIIKRIISKYGDGEYFFPVGEANIETTIFVTLTSFKENTMHR